MDYQQNSWRSSEEVCKHILLRILGISLGRCSWQFSNDIVGGFSLIFLTTSLQITSLIPSKDHNVRHAKFVHFQPTSPVWHILFYGTFY